MGDKYLSLDAPLQLEIVKLKELGLGTKGISKRLDCSTSYIRQVIRQYKNRDEIIKDREGKGNIILDHNEKVRINQGLRDKLRIERATNRQEFRIQNALIEYNIGLIRAIKTLKLKATKSHKSKEGNDINYGIIHLTDTHFNELINIKSNKYDFNVAAKRLQKFAYEASRLLKLYNVNVVLIAITGDLLNSDRRLDELMNQSTNRSNATMLSVALLKHFILDLNNNFNIKIAYVSGNEGRVKKESGNSEILASYNYDITIMKITELLFRDSEGVEFIDNDSVVECVVEIGGNNILMMHGHSTKTTNVTKTIQQIKTKYSDMGISVDFVLFGHYHSTLITDLYSRGSSLCGANSYSDSGLNLSSKAAQNIHVIKPDGINSIKVCLQDADGYKGYNIEADLDLYAAKSMDKVKSMKVPKI